MFCDRADVEVFLRYSPQVRVLEDPHYSLDAVHRDALLETAETCRRTRRETGCEREETGRHHDLHRVLELVTATF